MSANRGELDSLLRQAFAHRGSAGQSIARPSEPTRIWALPSRRSRDFSRSIQLRFGHCFLTLAAEQAEHNFAGMHFWAKQQYGNNVCGAWAGRRTALGTFADAENVLFAMCLLGKPAHGRLWDKPLKLLARPTGFEPVASAFGG